MGCSDGPAGWCRRRRRTRAGISPEQVSLAASAPPAHSRSVITHRARHWDLRFLLFCLWPPPEIPPCFQSWNAPLLPPVPGLINRPAAYGSLIHHSWQLWDDKSQSGGLITVLWGTRSTLDELTQSHSEKHTLLYRIICIQSRVVLLFLCCTVSVSCANPEFIAAALALLWQ